MPRIGASKICKVCGAQRARRSYNTSAFCNKHFLEYNNNKTKKWQRANRAKYLKMCREATSKRKYGISLVEREHILTAQGNACAICGSTIGFNGMIGSSSAGACIDHNHKNGKFRGILCGACNSGLGYFKDDPARLKAAIYYLLGR